MALPDECDMMCMAAPPPPMMAAPAASALAPPPMMARSAAALRGGAPLPGGTTGAPPPPAPGKGVAQSVNMNHQQQQQINNDALQKYRAAKHKRAQGKANAARVSVGSKYEGQPLDGRGSGGGPSPDAYACLHFDAAKHQNLKRNESEHITATIVLFYTVAGGVPTNTDVMNAIDDLEELYEKC